VVLFTCSLSGIGQNLSLGVVAGGSVTNGLGNTIFLNSAGGGIGGVQPVGTRVYSLSRDYVVGARVGWSLTSAWSVEADGLFRQFHAGSATLFSDGTQGNGTSEPIVTWEFPVLAKYRFGGSTLQPFVKVGPSFRAAGNFNRDASPSHLGVAAGLGTDIRSRGFVMSPEVRYTRWRSDQIPRDGIATKQDQVEVLVGFSRQSSNDLRPLGNRISVGVVLGTTLTQDFPTGSFPFAQQIVTVLPGGAEIISSERGFRTSDTRRSLIVGPALQLRLSQRWGIEADALHRSITQTRGEFLEDGTVLVRPFTYTLSKWEVPVLAQYAFDLPVARPRFRLSLEAGVAVRFPSSTVEKGVVLGTGVSTKLGPFRMQPMVRFTHWTNPDLTLPNQVEMLVKLAF